MTTPAAPAGHISDHGVLIGHDGARRRLVVYEDPQCPFCRRFEQRSGDLLSREVAAGAVAVEYRMRSLLGEESVRANNALALAAEEGRFDQLRRELFAAQPPEHSGGFTPDDLVALGERAGLTSSAYVDGVRGGRYEQWVRRTDELLQDEDPDGVPQATLDGEPVDPQVLYEPEELGALIRA